MSPRAYLVARTLLQGVGLGWGGAIAAGECRVPVFAGWRPIWEALAFFSFASLSLVIFVLQPCPCLDPTEGEADGGWGHSTS